MDRNEQRIKIAVQKSGRLTDHSLDLLERCGLKFTQSKDQLFCYGENMPIDLLLVRDLGICGLNVVEEKRLKLAAAGIRAPLKQIFELDFGHCRLSIAAPDGVEFTGVETLQNSRIATSYVNVLNDFLARNRIDAEVVYLSGAVEITPKLGNASGKRSRHHPDGSTAR
jgi:ATP phosphoribosyltransferase